MRAALAAFSMLASAASASAQPPVGAPVGARASHTDPIGPVVVHAPSALWVSRDDGRSFASMPSPVPNVRDVAIEEDGAIVVLGGTDHGEEALLARVRADGTTAPVPIPSWASAIAVGGGVLVATFPYEGAIGIARHGGDLVMHRVPPAFAVDECARAPSSDACSATRMLSTEASLFVDRDGTAHVVDVEVNTCGSSDVLDWARVLVVDPDGAMRARALFHARGPHEIAAVPPAITVYPTRWTAGPLGWAYALDDDGHVATLGRSGATPRALEGPEIAPGPQLAGGTPVPLASNGALTVAQVGAALVRLDGARARLLDRAVPADAQVVDVDARGRVLAAGERALHRWSRRDGWQTIWRAP